MKDIGNYIVYEDGRVWSKHYNKLLKPFNRNGYLRVNLDGKTFSHHRLLAELFIPNPNNLPQVNHKNGIKNDNRLDNLEWCDNSYNQKHAWYIGLNKGNTGKKHSDETKLKMSLAKSKSTNVV